MISLKRFLFPILSLVFFLLTPFSLRAEFYTSCAQYTDCDLIVACQLSYDIDTAMSGIGVDYNKSVADALIANPSCKNYPDSFKRDIDAQITDNVRLVINWNNVRAKMQMNNLGGMDNAEDAQIIEAIVNFFGPDTEEQKKFFTALATAYVAAWHINETTHMDDAFVINFLGEDNNFELYRKVLVELTGHDVEEELGIDVNWDDILDVIAEVMDRTHQQRGFLVCENNRSWQWTIDAVGWIATAVAAIFTVYAGGAGGAAVGVGRAALGTGLKAAAKGIAKVGGKAASKRLARAGTKQMVKAAVKLGVKSPATAKYITNYSGKGLLKTGVKKFVKDFSLKAALKNKWTRISATGALIYWVGKKNVNGAMGTIYSLFESGIAKDYINCQDLDHNEGCYTVCGDNIMNSELNTADFINAHAFYPMFNKYVCVDPNDYTLHEVDSNGNVGAIFTVDGSKWRALKQKLVSEVVDKSTKYKGLRQWGCDWNEDDIDMYIGFLIHDPDTLEIDKSGMVVDDFLRLDD